MHYVNDHFREQVKALGIAASLFYASSVHYNETVHNRSLMNLCMPSRARDVFGLLLAIAVAGGGLVTCRPRATVKLPTRCMSVAQLRLRASDTRRLTAMLRKDTRPGNPVNVYHCCLVQVITASGYGLMKIENPLSSHSTAQYFIRGRKGIFLLEAHAGAPHGRALDQALAENKDVLDEQYADSIRSYLTKAHSPH